MLYGALSSKGFDTVLPGGKKFEPFPRAGDREGWNAVPEKIKNGLITRGESLRGKKYSVLPASVYMEFAKTGDRKNYEDIYFERRHGLIDLVAAECAEGEGRFIPDIIDVLWAICEETTWVIPAHNNKGELCDIEYETYVDLFSAETASALAWTHYFLADEIAAVSPTAKRRIELEIERRVIEPYLAFDHFWYMGFRSASVNNWNPWINTNVLTALLLMMPGKRETMLRGVEKTARSIDVFINSYKGDGACDEGPGYFCAAGEALLDYLEIIRDVTGGAVDLFGDELIGNIARYIYRVYIGNGYFVNFADAQSGSGVSSAHMARVGKAVGDENLIAFAREINRSGNFTVRGGNFTVSGNQLYRRLKDIFDPTPEAGAYTFSPPTNHWFCDNQIMVARDSGGAGKGMFVAAKGGHNAESHNHNDVGSFILYSDGLPVVVDPGVGTYTKQTFSADRYKIWTMQSCCHSLPTVNGFDQAAGRDRRAEDVEYECEGGTARLTMELARAYPAEAEIQALRRTLTFERGIAFTVRDEYRLGRAGEPPVFNLMLFCEPELGAGGLGGGIIRLGGRVEMRYDPNYFEPQIERFTLDDQRMKDDWKREALHRLRLIGKTASPSGSYEVSFRLL